MNKDQVTYLGDGLYAKFDGYHLEIYSWDGIKMENQVFLDFPTRQALRNLIDSIDVRENHGEI